MQAENGHSEISFSCFDGLMTINTYDFPTLGWFMMSCSVYYVTFGA